MQRINYQKLLDEVIKAEGYRRPRLLLHVCCAPCSSACLEYLNGSFDITIFFFNPNITEYDEYEKRLKELRRFNLEAGYNFPIIEGEYEPERFLSFARELSEEPEGGVRCEKCYRLRLEESAMAAKKGDFEYFTTTLSVSPHKNSEKLNCIGGELAEKYKVKYLFSDFKKGGGYTRSIELSREYGLYRQSYCGCEFSRDEAVRRGRL